MNIEQLSAEVAAELVRPNSLAEIKSFVRQATKAIHSSMLYKMDLAEDIITLPQAEYSAKVVLPPFFRRFEAVHPVDSLGNIAELNNFKGFEIVEPDDIYTESGRMLINIVYLTGRSFAFRADFSLDKLKVMYYAYPDLTSDLCETWVTQDHYDTVKNGAKYMLLSVKDQAERANSYRAMYLESLQQIMRDHGGAK